MPQSYQSFLDHLKNVVYKDNEHIANAIDYSSKILEQDHVQLRVRALNKTFKKNNSLKPETTIIALIGADFSRFKKKDFITLFGKKNYTLACNIFSTEKNYSNLEDLFSDNGEEISHLFLSSATETLKDIIMNAEKYDKVPEDQFYSIVQVQSHVGFSVPIKNKKDDPVYQEFETYAAHLCMPYQFSSGMEFEKRTAFLPN